MGNETTIVKEILLGIGQTWPDRIRVWRNNTGALKDEHGRLIRFGLNGSADISGIISPRGVRLEIEVKTETGRPSKQQLAFGDMILAHGGWWILARSWAEVKEVLTDLLKDMDHGRA